MERGLIEGETWMDPTRVDLHRTKIIRGRRFRTQQKERRCTDEIICALPRKASHYSKGQEGETETCTRDR